MAGDFEPEVHAGERERSGKRMGESSDDRTDGRVLDERVGKSLGDRPREDLGEGSGEDTGKSRCDRASEWLGE